MSSDKVSCMLLRGALVCAFLLIVADARDVFSGRLAEAENEIDPYGFIRTRKAADWVPEDDCPVHKMEHVHTVMDRVCLMCHEMFSHGTSTLRFECRQNCFDNIVFRKCLSVFTAPGQVITKKP